MLHRTARFTIAITTLCLAPCLTVCLTLGLTSCRSGFANDCVPTGTEGPPWDPSCTDELDNDCSGEIDGIDPACTSYTNDFQSDNGEFSYANTGNWNMGGGALSVNTCSDGEGATIAGASFGDVEVSATVTMTSTCALNASAGLAVRMSGPESCPDVSGYKCIINPVDGYLAIYYISPDFCGGVLAEDFYPFQPEVSYVMTMTAEGDEISCTVTGGDILREVSIIGFDPDFEEGTVGFGALGTSAEFRDFAAFAL